MSDPGHDVREVRDRRLIALAILVDTVSGLDIGIGGYRITDPARRDQLGIRSEVGRVVALLRSQVLPRGRTPIVSSPSAISTPVPGSGTGENTA
jgi:hypothetical protein